MVAARACVRPQAACAFVRNEDPVRPSQSSGGPESDDGCPGKTQPLAEEQSPGRGCREGVRGPKRRPPGFAGGRRDEE